MTPFALFPLLASILAIFLGNSVYGLDKKKPLNIIFALFAFSLSFWAFTEFMYRQADTATTAYYWMKMGFIWTIPTALTVHFALVYTEKIKSLKNTAIALVLYVPAAIFSLIYLTTDLITTGVVQKFWGYTYVASDSWVCTASNFWAFALTFSAIFLCLKYYLKINEKTKKQQAKFVTLGFLIPVFISFITEGLLPFWHTEIPELTTISSLLLGLFVGYAIWKYHLFKLNPATAVETIISTMSDPLVLTDQNQRVLKVNQALTSYLGYSEMELLGKSMNYVFQEQTLQKENKLLEIATAKKHEIKLKTKYNEEKYALFSSSDVKSKNGQIMGTVYIIHDVTQLKLLEARLVKSERFAAIGELAGMVGHDLRNPLTSIKNAAYYLKKKGTSCSEAKYKTMLEIIDSSIDHSNKIINDLLDYSKEIHLELEERTPRLLLAESLMIVGVPDKVKLIDKTNDEPKMMVDTTKIVRCFVNLIKNAIDAMPEGGTLEVQSVQEGGNVGFVFKDTGIGMSEEIMAKLFSPLFTTKAQGMGFGLAICKRVVEAHGGTIIVQSSSGKGTRFIVTLSVNPKLEVAVEEEWENMQNMQDPLLLSTT